MSAFLMTLAQAEEFYRRCMEEKAETLEQRLEVMKKMIEERRAFPQTEEQVNKRLQGKKVLYVRNKRSA